MSPSPDAAPDSPENGVGSSTSSPGSSELFDRSSSLSRTYPASSRLAGVRDVDDAARFYAGIAVEAAQDLAAALNSPSWGTSARWRELRALDVEQRSRSSPDTPAPTSPWSAPRWPNSGTAWLGGFSTAASSECRSAGGVCSSSEPSLVDVLEPSAPGRFSLSGKAASGILRRAERRGRSLPAPLREVLEALEVGMTSEPTKEPGS